MEHKEKQSKDFFNAHGGLSNRNSHLKFQLGTEISVRIYLTCLMPELYKEKCFEIPRIESILNIIIVHCLLKFNTPVNSVMTAISVEQFFEAMYI